MCMDDKVRAGIVGSQFAAGFHCRSLVRSGHAEIVAACSIDPPSLKQLAEVFNIPHTYDDYNKMLERSDIELVHVCVPNFLHKRVAVAALEAGKHVICEKPLATNMTDAMAMVRAVRKSGLKFMYAEDWLSAPSILRAKQIIDEGGIGRPCYVKAKETHSGTHSPFAQKKQFAGGGAMIHLAIHPMAFARWLFGCEAVEAAGMTNGGGQKNFVHTNYGGEDWSAALLTYEGGQRAFVEGNYITHGGLDDFIEIYGTEGSIKIDLGFGSPMTVYSRKGYNYAVEKAETTLHWTKPAVDEEWNLGYVHEIAHFVDCVRLDREPGWGLGVEDGAAVLQSIMAVYEAAATGKTVKIKPLFPKKTKSTRKAGTGK